MQQEQFWILLSKKLAGEASGPELAELERLMLEHPEWQYAAQNLQEIWNTRGNTDSAQDEDAYLIHLHRLNEYTEEACAQVRRPRRRWMAWTAVAATILLAGWFFGIRNQGAKNPDSATAGRSVNEVTTRPGSKSRVELPDGSVVWLNAGSQLTYNRDFGQKLREVNLSGEGYFDVVKMPEKPFIIHTRDVNIRVLGTVFNVKAYPQDKKTETSLIRGSIEVTIRNRPSDKIILSPSEKLVVEHQPVMPAGEALPGRLDKQSAPLIAVNKLQYNPADSSVAETEWIHNRLVFRDESLGELALRMERWYNRTISIEDAELRNTRVSGIFETETLEEALQALQISVRFAYETEGKNIIIHR